MDDDDEWSEIGIGLGSQLLVCWSRWSTFTLRVACLTCMRHEEKEETEDGWKMVVRRKMDGYLIRW